MIDVKWGLKFRCAADSLACSAMRQSDRAHIITAPVVNQLGAEPVWIA